MPGIGREAVRVEPRSMAKDYCYIRARMRIIAGDIGGTKTLLQLVEIEGPAQNVIDERRFASGDYATFDDLLREFVGESAVPVDAACFAVAGPVLENRAEVTNLK